MSLITLPTDLLQCAASGERTASPHSERRERSLALGFVALIVIGLMATVFVR